MMTCYASIDSNSITCHLLLPSLSTNKPPVFGSCVLSFALWPGQPPQIEHDESMRQSGRRKKQLELASLPLLDNKNIQKHTKTIFREYISHIYNYKYITYRLYIYILDINIYIYHIKIYTNVNDDIIKKSPYKKSVFAAQGAATSDSPMPFATVFLRCHRPPATPSESSAKPVLHAVPHHGTPTAGQSPLRESNLATGCKIIK